ncbi:drug/metabolite transporter (DMT)-like permease [Rhodoplanes tepidamans]|uniref:DMT family transporter n=2 Tax=Rhodoplanes TaxID=29407 RepID=A0ABT5JCW6_RHOTP|nr:DMT family transporter [Rhodoplanes tepidamans]MDC7787467.1 DMT family transporter [Rhodoplanes tepidamans]MDQ0354381.1 drug/metabolite transporter (DMT)-like permease [Rhodoplanes tepidamans]
MQPARPLDALATATIVALSLSWGLNQVAIKAAVPDIPPLVQGVIRSSGALLMLLAWAWARRVRLFSRDGSLLPGLVAGILFGCEFIMIYRGLMMTTASRGTIFLYTAPLFVALGGSFLLPGERLGRLQWFGLVTAFAGVVVAIGAPQLLAAPPAGAGAAGAGAPPGSLESTLAGDALLLVSAVFWASTTLVVKGTRLVHAAPEKTLGYQLACSIPILGLAALWFGESLPGVPRAAAVSWLAYQTIWVVGITYGLWFALVKHYSASRLSAFTFLTPLFGVVAGHVVLGDAIDWPFAVAAALVVAGLVLVNRPRRTGRAAADGANRPR